jgi:hypothetical protein
VTREYEAILVDRDGFVRTRTVTRPFPREVSISQAVRGGSIERGEYRFVGGDVDRHGKTHPIYEEVT